MTKNNTNKNFITTYEAKTNLSKLLARVLAGEEIIIGRGNIPVARLIPFYPVQQPRKLGSERGKFTIPDNFNEELPDEIIESFYKSDS